MQDQRQNKGLGQLFEGRLVEGQVAPIRQNALRQVAPLDQLPFLHIGKGKVVYTSSRPTTNWPSMSLPDPTRLTHTATFTALRRFSETHVNERKKQRNGTNAALQLFEVIQPERLEQPEKHFLYSKHCAFAHFPGPQPASFASLCPHILRAEVAQM